MAGTSMSDGPGVSPGMQVVMNGSSGTFGPPVFPPGRGSNVRCAPAGRNHGYLHRRARHQHALTLQPPTQSSNGQDRKSTRLNSSHSQISYAVFCLKKKKKKKTQ